MAAGGTALANQVSPGGGVLADTDDFEPAMLVLTTAPTAPGDGGLTGNVAGGGHRGTAPKPPARTTTTTTAPTTTTKVKPTTTPKPPATSTVQQAPNASQTDQVFTLVNQQRQQAGCTALKDDSRLDTAAQGHSTDMATQHYFDHTTPAGVTFDKRETAAGYPSPGGENIAMGQTSAQQVMTDWMNSPGHRANILNCQFTAIGIGLDTNGWYWTQDFG